MIPYCAFLRGVNVNGTSMKMADVVEVFKEVGMQNVDFILASGNILFESADDKPELKVELEKAMSHRFQYTSILHFLRLDEVHSIVQNCPFEKLEDHHIYVFIGKNAIEEVLLEEFKLSKNKSNESAAIQNTFFYWQVPKGSTIESDFGKILGKKAFKEKCTSRNLNTFEKIAKKRPL